MRVKTLFVMLVLSVAACGANEVLGEPGELEAADEPGEALDDYDDSAETDESDDLEDSDDGDEDSDDGDGAEVPTDPLNSFKWHPGNYIFPGNFNCDANAQGDDFALMDEVASMPNVKGIYVHWQWSCFEGATAGDYTAGFAKLDAYIAKAASVGKKFAFGLWTMQWGNCAAGSVTNTNNIPQYIRDLDGVSYCTTDGRIYTARWWRSNVVDRIIALSAALGARYDSSPTVAFFELHEESAGISGGDEGTNGFTWAASQAQWDRAQDATAAQWPTTVIRNSLNWGESQWLRDTMVNKARPGMIFGGADSMPESTFWIAANRIWRGLNTDGSDNPNWSDLRGTGRPWIAEIQGDPLIYGQNCTAALYDYSKNTMQANFILWSRQSHDTVTCRYWNPGGGAGLKPFINAGSSTMHSTSCPTGWKCTQ